jgi:Leucine-rich repeat (LRR) protein
LQDYPNLKTLYACGLDLAGVKIDCGSLENLYLTGNKLAGINLSKTPNLVNLSVGGNKLSTITGIDKLTKLEDLRCNANQLKSLNIQKLKNL